MVVGIMGSLGDHFHFVNHESKAHNNWYTYDLKVLIYEADWSPRSLFRTADPF